MSRHDDIRQKALEDLQRFKVLMIDGHFDFGNGYHGRAYLNPHQLFRYPSTIWRFAQDLIDLLPASIVDQTDLVAGPVTGGALLAHTIAGLLDSRRKLTEPARLFAPFAPDATRGHALRAFCGAQMAGRRVLLADDVRNTGQTFERCAALVAEAGGTVIGTVEIYDRLEAIVDLGVPNIALAEYRTSDNYPVADCPMCRQG
ncbi:MAG: phosphoribosyltransferase family protein, partial [Acidobacteria bacterium]|nr:phosphoribosyltransferase family protein [Acidobacteriota bacterium]